jgi:hypothetical protein
MSWCGVRFIAWRGCYNSAAAQQAATRSICAQSGNTAYTVAIEIRPVLAAWSPFFVAIPADQATKAIPQCDSELTATNHRRGPSAGNRKVTTQAGGYACRAKQRHRTETAITSTVSTDRRPWCSDKSEASISTPHSSRIGDRGRRWAFLPHRRLWAEGLGMIVITEPRRMGVAKG